jgi:hypothetical protein
MRMDDCDACLKSKAHQLPYPSHEQKSSNDCHNHS